MKTGRAEEQMKEISSQRTPKSGPTPKRRVE
jgi:hypothetical protein